MFNNIILSEKKLDWLDNDELLGNQGTYLIANDLQLNLISEFTI